MAAGNPPTSLAIADQIFFITFFLSLGVGLLCVIFILVMHFVLERERHSESVTPSVFIPHHDLRDYVADCTESEDWDRGYRRDNFGG